MALGNPERRYLDTRHNAAWWFADRLSRRWGCPPFRVSGSTAFTARPDCAPPVEIHKPLTYMNRSGEAVHALTRSGRLRGPRDLLVVVDDIALPPGRVRLRPGGSAGGHNGLSSIAGALQSDRYWRLRLGVGRPARRGADLAAWVLAPMEPAEEETLLGGFDRAEQFVNEWLSRGNIETDPRRD